MSYPLNHGLRAGLLAIAITTIAACGRSEAPATPAPVQEVSFITVQTQPLAVISDLPGRINAVRVAEVRARVAGILLAQQLRGGTQVKAGQVLFRIDPAPLQAVYQSADANLQRSLALQEQAQSKADRFKTLVEYNAVSRQDFVDSQAAAQSTKADVAAARAALQTAKLNLGYATVTAPISGYMGKPEVTEGALVGQNEPTLLTRIQQLDPIYIDLTQSSGELLRIRQAVASGKLQGDRANGLKVSLFLDDGSRYPHQGRLLFSDVEVDQTTGMVTLRAEFPNPDHDLLPGMFAHAKIAQALTQDVILLPQRVVTMGANATASVLLIDAQNKVETREVRLGEARGEQWVVREGLQPGDRVVVEGLQKVAPGDTVNPKPYQAPAKPATSAQPGPAPLTSNNPSQD